MTSVDTILYQAKQKSEESARRCTVSGDDSFYCSGESNNSTSPTSSITSSGSFGNESDEGFPRRVSEESTRNKATKNLEKSVVLFRTIKREPEDKNCDLIPMDLSCHKRTSLNKTFKPANMDKNNLVVKPEPVDDYPNFAESRPTQFKPSTTFEKTVAPTAQPPTTFASSMFAWPYFPNPITSNGLPAFPPSYLAGKYFHPGLFLPATGNAPTSCSSVPTTNSLNYATGNSMLTGLHQLTAANHLQPPLLQALLSPQSAAQGSTVAENNSKNPHHTSNTNIYHSTSSPRNFESDPSLLTEFAKVFSSQVEQLRPKLNFLEYHEKTLSTERRRKNAKPTKVSSSPPHPKKFSAFSFQDLPTMLTQGHDNISMYGGAQKDRQDLKRKNTQEDFQDHASFIPNSKKMCSDSLQTGTLTTWREVEIPPTPVQKSVGTGDDKGPQPVNFKPCRIPCVECGRTYATIGALAKHAKTHDDPESGTKFNCKICKKECSSLGALRMHIRTHTLPCECHICGKAFSRTWLLQGHIRTHTGEKPYQCTVCSRAFADRSNLRAHMQTHETVKRYSCVSCEKTFSRISLLKRHQVHCESMPKVAEQVSL